MVPSAEIYKKIFIACCGGRKWWQFFFVTNQNFLYHIETFLFLSQFLKDLRLEKIKNVFQNTIKKILKWSESEKTKNLK